MNKPSLKLLLEQKEAILFDLFHTLTSLEDTSPGTPMTAEYLGIDRKEWNSQLMEHSEDRLTGKETDPFAIMEKLVHAIDASIDNSKIKQAAERRMELFDESLIRIPESTIAVIRELKNKGKKIGLVSNADVLEKHAWNDSPAAQYFDSVIFSCDAGYAKPDPEIYQIAMKELGVDAAASAFVGDGGSNELRGARSLGITSIMITGIVERLWPDEIDKRKPDADYIIRDLKELLV